ncbi:FadR/GntR family transcriptional regulator [Methylobacterium sp. JK268]
MSEPLLVFRARPARACHAVVARAIAIDIIAGRYAEGARLPGDAELLDLFGVSRPVLRESVKTLVAKGLLTTRARIGTVVRQRGAWNMFDPDVLAWHLETGIDRRFVADLAEIRLAVEPRAAELAAARRSEADLAAMRDGLARMVREPSGSAGFAEGDLDLHIAVATASGNPFMRAIEGVVDAALRATFRLCAPVREEDRQLTLALHTRIVETIAAHDAPQAAEAMRAVILNGLSRSPGAR